MPPPELAVVIPIDSRRSSDTGDRLRGDATESAVARMLDAISVDPAYDRAALCACIEAVQDCAQAAIACADACLAEEMVEELTGCIRTLINTADVCDVTARVLSRRTGPDRTLTRALLGACWTACRRAREVCEEFLPIHDPCRVCARACRAAERACRTLIASAEVAAHPPEGAR